ncbi:regulation of AMPA receptor activity protein [Homalodisca vitripennis]|nr:regulation of AMPA receptor activity protein [Homalodisca vitripennis]
MFKNVFVTAGENEMHCTNIEYFSKEEYSPDPNDSTMAIPYPYSLQRLLGQLTRRIDAQDQSSEVHH